MAQWRRIASAVAKRTGRRVDRDTATRILKSGELSTCDSAMQFHIQFLDGSARVIRELFADARSYAGVIELIADIDWPP